MTLQCISLWQPWASAVAFRIKEIETRCWLTNYRGTIGIHAAQRRSPDLRFPFEDMLDANPRIRVAFSGVSFDALPFGAIVAIAELVDCKPVRDVDLARLSPAERALGDYSKGRCCWFFRNVRRLPNPIDVIGRQGFFKVEVDL